MKNIYLFGFMGSGKSTIGRILAKSLGSSYIDTDSEIQKKAGCSIAAIFQQKGEPTFRCMETDLLKELSCRSNLVVSCGGGMMANAENAAIARQNGILVLLNLSFEACWQRIRFSQRPLVTQNTKEQLEAIFKERMPKYKANAQIAIDADQTPYLCSMHILQLINGIR